jgi:transcriptional regulator with XRE-family HTH domain
MSKLNERVVELVNLSGMKYKQVAKVAGITAQMFSHIITGKRGCTVLNAIAINDALAPVIGDRFDYIARGIKPNNLESLKSCGFSSGFLHRDDALQIFRNSLARARRRGVLVSSDHEIDEIESSFILEMSEKISFIVHKKEG